MEQRLKSCLSAHFSNLGSGADDVVPQVLLPLLDTFLPMTCQVAAFTMELVAVRVDRPDQDRAGPFCESQHHLLDESGGQTAMPALQLFDFLKKLD